MISFIFFTATFVFDLLMIAQLSIIIHVVYLFQVFDINGLFYRWLGKLLLKINFRVHM